jgi:NAD(P)-dependent dehydrogenase (short-subunit alcohol dehydrogenase family)
MDGIVRRVAVVTGASGGIGRWIARGLAERGLHTVLLCRDRVRGEAASAWIAAQSPGASTELYLADFASLEAVRAAGRAIAAAHPRIAVLVNNAGMFSAARKLTKEGREMVLAVNHLAAVVLTDALEPALLAGAPSRIVMVGSSTSDHARIDPGDLELAQGWGLQRAYARSKLAMMMSAFVRAERLRCSGVVVNVVHPGAVATGLIREGGPIGLAWRAMAPFMLTEEQGAVTPLRVSLAPEWAAVTGAYAKKRAAARPNPRALDHALAARVDAVTRDLIGRTLPPG